MESHSDTWRAGAPTSQRAVDADRDTGVAVTARHLPGRRPPRVIVVDDEDLVRYELVELLQDSGITVVAQAAEGATGFDLATKLRPDVVLMDLRMPGMGGTEATRLVKKTLPRTEVVMLTAYEDRGLRERNRSAGAHSYLVKGCSSQRIIDAINQATEHARSRAPRRPERPPP